MVPVMGSLSVLGAFLVLFTGYLILIIKNRINSHFGFQLDYSLLFRINLLKWMIIQDQIEEIKEVADKPVITKVS